MPPRPPSRTLFPYTTLFRSVPPVEPGARGGGPAGVREPAERRRRVAEAARSAHHRVPAARPRLSRRRRDARDRKSTRLNSSHVEISYAVFCLKKKNHPNALQ